MTKILRAQALREMEIKETPQGKQKTFSIKFIKKNGEIVHLPKAVATGLKFDMKEHGFRGAVAVDNKYNPISHVYPIHIDNIIEFNNATVKL